MRTAIGFSTWPGVMAAALSLFLSLITWKWKENGVHVRVYGERVDKWRVDNEGTRRRYENEVSAPNPCNIALWDEGSAVSDVLSVHCSHVGRALRECIHVLYIQGVAKIFRLQLQGIKWASG